MLANIAEAFGMERKQICMVGDRLDTDILFGQDGGLSTMLVLSGMGIASPGLLQSAKAPVTMPQGMDSILGWFCVQRLQSWHLRVYTVPSLFLSPVATSPSSYAFHLGAEKSSCTHFFWQKLPWKSVSAAEFAETPIACVMFLYRVPMHTQSRCILSPHIKCHILVPKLGRASSQSREAAGMPCLLLYCHCSLMCTAEPFQPGAYSCEYTMRKCMSAPLSLVHLPLRVVSALYHSISGSLFYKTKAA